MKGIGLSSGHIVGPDGQPTPLGQMLLDYFRYRADVLNTFVEPRLMNAAEAKRLYRRVRGKGRFMLPALR